MKLNFPDLKFYIMRKCGVLLLIVVLSGCKTIKMLSNQEFSEVSKEMQMEFIGNKLFTNVNIRDSVYKLIFDTGASKTVISDTALFDDYYKLAKIKIGKTKLVNKTVSLDKVVFDSKNEMYESQNEIVIIIIPELDACNSKKIGKGVLGTSYFTFIDKKILNLDFESVKAKVLSKFEKEELLKDYQQIKSEFIMRGNHFNIFLNINGVEEPFFFDTGNSAAPLVIGSKSKVLLKDGIEYHGSLVAGVDNTKSNDVNIYYSNVNFQFGKIRGKSLVFYYGAYIDEHNNVGLSFIKNFNWIIDYKNKEVYYKQIKEDFPKEFSGKYKYLASNNNGNLYVSTKLHSAAEYNIGDQITVVDGIPVIAANLCEMQSLLNKTTDWSTLNLQIIPVQQKK